MQKQRLLAVTAITVGVALIIGAMALTGNGDESTANAPPAAEIGASRDAGPAPASTDATCSTIDVQSVVLALEPSVVGLFADNGLIFDTLAPAQELAAGESITPLVTASQDVACDLTAGVVRTQGGFRVSKDDNEVNFRRFRMELDEGEIYAFFKASGPSDFEAFDLKLDEAQFTTRGTIVSAVVPMVLDVDAAVAMNAALGTDFLGDLVELGTMTITGTRTEAVAPAR